MRTPDPILNNQGLSYHKALYAGISLAPTIQNPSQGFWTLRRVLVLVARTA